MYESLASKDKRHKSRWKKCCSVRRILLHYKEIKIFSRHFYFIPLCRGRTEKETHEKKATSDESCFNIKGNIRARKEKWLSTVNCFDVQIIPRFVVINSHRRVHFRSPGIFPANFFFWHSLTHWKFIFYCRQLSRWRFFLELCAAVM